MKRRDLKPMLDYFNLLQVYEGKGYLEMLPREGEAYVTRAALYTLTGGSTKDEVMSGIPAVVRRLRYYAAWKSQQGAGYFLRPFAVNVVDDTTHAPKYTVLLTRHRSRLLPWRKKDHFKVVNYD